MAGQRLAFTLEPGQNTTKTACGRLPSVTLASQAAVSVNAPDDAAREATRHGARQVSLKRGRQDRPCLLTDQTVGNHGSEGIGAALGPLGLTHQEKGHRYGIS